MKHKVLKPFRDKYTNKIYEKGSTIDLEDNRALEIVGTIGPHYLEKVVIPDNKVVKKPRTKTVSNEAKK